MKATKTIHVRYVPWLSICLALFLFRVSAQLVQYFCDLPYLPPFKAWQSGALAYPWLLASQLLILTVMVSSVLRFAKGRIEPNKKLGAWLLAAGSAYFLVMLFRLVAGFTFAAQHSWLGAHLPAFFHLVLASFVLLIGHFHFHRGTNAAPHA